MQRRRHRSWILWLILCKCLYLGTICSKSCLVCSVLVLLTELKEILDRISRGSSQSPQRAPKTSETIGDESDISKRGRNGLYKKTFGMKKRHGADELGNSLSLGQRTHQISPVIFNARFAGTMFRSWLTAFTRFCSISRELAISRAIRGCASKHLGDEF